MLKLITHKNIFLIPNTQLHNSQRFKSAVTKSVILNESIGKYKVRYQKPVKPAFQHEPIVPIEKLSFDKAVSGTLVHDEDLAETNRHEIKFDGQVNSLTARGFLRFQKPYDPPENARERLMSLVHSLIPTLKSKGSDIMSYPLTDSRLKYDLLSKAFEEFQHAVPNSMLYMVQTIGDVDQFYHTPIKTTTPYDELARTKDLPPNLHIQKEPLRFNPETDTMFGGINAYPKSSTLVTGLYARRKFKGTVAKRSWP